MLSASGFPLLEALPRSLRSGSQTGEPPDGMTRGERHAARLGFVRICAMEVLLGLVPEGFHVGARDGGEGSALFAGEFFHFVKAPDEFLVGTMHGDFRVDSQKAREVDSNEEKITQFIFDVRGLG